ncbi:MAG: hypothetical protein LBB61_00285 [Treponema sp.]|jgi:hypothetical protein|nr:hypothetical protein [Treponema sp.]
MYDRIKPEGFGGSLLGGTGGFRSDADRFQKRYGSFYKMERISFEHRLTKRRTRRSVLILHGREGGVTSRAFSSYETGCIIRFSG